MSPRISDRLLLLELVELVELIGRQEVEELLVAAFREHGDRELRPGELRRLVWRRLEQGAVDEECAG